MDGVLFGMGLMYLITLVWLVIKFVTFVYLCFYYFHSVNIQKNLKNLIIYYSVKLTGLFSVKEVLNYFKFTVSFIFLTSNNFTKFYKTLQ
jgi:hypothetical protein